MTDRMTVEQAEAEIRSVPGWEAGEVFCTGAFARIIIRNQTAPAVLAWGTTQEQAIRMAVAAVKASK